MDELGDDLVPRPSLPGDVDVDVAIVGAGYTGLWTAYYLLKADPNLRVAILEREIAGFGASGRNGGWCSALFAASHKKIAANYGRDAAVALQQEMFATVDEVGRATSAEGIDCDFHKGGTLTLVTSPTQLVRVRKGFEEERSWGFSDDDLRWLDAEETARRIRIAGCLGAAYTPHCARIHPAKLVRGLAEVVESLGATIYERTPVIAISPQLVTTPAGKVKAPIVVRATEAYSTQLPGHRRHLVPLYSLMIATEPLPTAAWKDIGWDNYETIHDGRHLLIYAQRTADDRIAIGGRGAPYHLGSGIDDRNDRVGRVHAALARILNELVPAAGDARVSHRWGGPVGVPRDWFSSVGLDRKTGLAWAGGYVGDGVATTNLAGRTLRDLILGADTELIRLPWVGHRSPRWEPEPLRWLGINTMIRVMASADRKEARTGKATSRGDFAKRLIGL
ncbi:MAG TPA: FAD-binding oxidoreductase [Actinomycetota bacterium]|nr:FAD-binding oxidoreductase [Actinomycetota bacterium]